MAQVSEDIPAERLSLGVGTPTATVAADGTAIAIRRQGKGIPVICLHATGHGGRDYAEFTRSISEEGFEPIIVDWPGHGASPPEATEQGVSAERYADILAELIPILCGEDKPILLGNSIGGAAALSYALREPRKVKALVLCNPGGLAPLTALSRFVIAAMVRFFRAGAGGSRWFAIGFAAYYRLVLPARPAREQRDRIVEAGPVMAPIMAQAWDSFRQPEADLRQSAKDLRLPTLFAWARQDQIVAWRFSRVAVQKIPNAEVRMFQEGHSPFLEDPEAFRVGFLNFTKQFSS